MKNSTDFLQLAENRYSVRKFSGEPVKKEDLDKIIRAGQLAPTACNRQPQKILVINDENSLAKLRKCTACHFNAPAAMLICYDKNECWKREFDGKSSGDIDASIVTTHIMLEAAAIGVGTTWVMYFIPEAVRTEFEIPENLEPTALLVMGYPSDDAKPYTGHSEIRPLEETVFYNSFR